MSINPDDLTDRQFVAGLMRGNAQTLQQGYSPEAAVMAVARSRDRSPEESAELLAYAQGFADGFIEDGLMGNPANRESDAAFTM